MKEKMLLQLHEQYAINNNANLGSMVTLLAAVIAIIGAFGYVMLHTSLSTQYEDSLFLCNGKYTLVALIITATGTHIVLSILKRICMYQGFAQRKEQFIIYAIRNKYQLVNTDHKKPIFPNYYKPFEKNDKEIYQGLFGKFIKIFYIVQLCVNISVFILIIYNIIYFNYFCPFGKQIDWTIIIFCILYSCIIIVTHCTYTKNKNRDITEYNNLQDFYGIYNMESNKTNKFMCKILNYFSL